MEATDQHQHNTPPSSDESVVRNIAALRIMVESGYALQKLRIQTGLRICANFRHQRSMTSTNEEGDRVIELDKEAEKLIDLLKADYRRLTDGIIDRKKKETLKREQFVGTDLITTFAEAVLTEQYIELETQERKNFKSLEDQLIRIPIYSTYLKDVIGIGPAMAAVIIVSFNPYKARHQSHFWALAGLDVARDGWGRSRRKEHLIVKKYTDRNGDEAERLSVSYDPWLKTKMTGVLAGSFLRSQSKFANLYYDYKHRLETDPNRTRMTTDAWKKVRKNLIKDAKEQGMVEGPADTLAKGERSADAWVREQLKNIWTPGRIDRAGKRYMVKMFLRELWRKWRELEGLPITRDYAVEKLGMREHGIDGPFKTPRAKPSGNGTPLQDGA